MNTKEQLLELKQKLLKINNELMDLIRKRHHEISKCGLSDDVRELLIEEGVEIVKIDLIIDEILAYHSGKINEISPITIERSWILEITVPSIVEKHKKLMTRLEPHLIIRA